MLKLEGDLLSKWLALTTFPETSLNLDSEQGMTFDCWLNLVVKLVKGGG